jgi:hypothetical protein
MGNFTSILNNYFIMLNFIKKHMYTYSWKFYLLFGVKIFKIGFDLHISFFIWNWYGRLYIIYKIEIEKQPFDGFQRYFTILSFLFQIRSTYYHVHNKTHF